MKIPLVEPLFSGYQWTILVGAFYIFSAYSSIKINEGSPKWFAINYVVGLIPLWSLVALYSKDILFSGMVWDAVMTVTYLVSICLMTGSFSRMSWVSLSGIVVAVGGLLMVKLGQRSPL